MGEGKDPSQDNEGIVRRALVHYEESAVNTRDAIRHKGEFRNKIMERYFHACFSPAVDRVHELLKRFPDLVDADGAPLPMKAFSMISDEERIALGVPELVLQFERYERRKRRRE